MLILRLAFRNATRNITRTALTAMTVLFGTAILTLALSWMNGIFGMILGSSAAQVGHVRVVDPDYVAREQLFPLYDNIPDATALAAKIAERPGVVAAYPRVLTGVALTASEEIGENFALVTGAPVAWYTEQLGLQEHVTSGALLSGKDGEVVLGSIIAERIGAKVGSEVVMIGQTQDGAMSPIKANVVGIVNAGVQTVDQGAFLPLAPLQYLADIGEGATEILVYGDDRDDAARLRRSLEGAPELAGHTVQAWSERDPWAGVIAIATVVQNVFKVVIVFITALGVWNTMMMSVLERTSEIGVMRSMGLGRLGAVALFVVEALTIATIGGLGGILVGGLGGAWLEKNGVELGDQIAQNMDAAIPFQARLYADVSPEVLLTAFALGIAMAFLGSAVPAMRAASIQPVEAMRTRN